LNQFLISLRVTAFKAIFRAFYSSSKILSLVFSKPLSPSTTKTQQNSNQENTPTKTKQKHHTQKQNPKHPPPYEKTNHQTTPHPNIQNRNQNTPYIQNKKHPLKTPLNITSIHPK
jgi:hypothetical protein